MFLERRVGTERFITEIASVRTQAGMGVEMHLQLGPALKLLVARRNGTGQLRSRSRLTRVTFNVLPQIVFTRENLAAVL